MEAGNPRAAPGSSRPSMLRSKGDARGGPPSRRLRYDPPVRTEPILLVHGLGSSFEHGWRAPGWADLIADANRTVIPVDLLGHGTAEAPHDPAAYAHLE